MLWAVNDGSYRQMLRADRPYVRMNIASATGLTPAQVAALKKLGAGKPARRTSKANR